MAGCAPQVYRPAIEPVASVGVIRSEPLGAYTVTIHVHLQVHPHPDEDRMASTAPEVVQACQDRVVANAVQLGKEGVAVIVVEGLVAAGSLLRPEPVMITSVPSGEESRAKWRLVRRPDLIVYGFEEPAANQFGITIVKQLGQSAGKARQLLQDSQNEPPPDQDQEYRRLLQEEMNRLNLWYGGVIPERSFLALRTTLAVALARGARELQLLLGKEHWNDLVYATQRHEDMHLSLIPYEC